MKELSIEDKAKRYDEAIKFAKIYHNQGDEDMKTMCETMFPELKESDEERIREWLICTLKSLNNSPVQIDGAYEMMLPAIAWLEKQGEKGINGNEREIPFSEQKPAIEMKSADESLGIDSKTYNKIVDECIYGEHKPTWSEDDETVVNSIISFCDFKVNIEQHNEGVKEVSKKVLSWLNELKSRVQPQSQWKPSDEQMEVIAQALAVLKVSGYGELGDRLGDISEQLNKLKA